jgi:hypothetical protein
MKNKQPKGVAAGAFSRIIEGFLRESVRAFAATIAVSTGIHRRHNVI